MPLVIHIYLGSLNTQMRLLWSDPSTSSIKNPSTRRRKKSRNRGEIKRSRMHLHVLIILVQVCTTGDDLVIVFLVICTGRRRSSPSAPSSRPSRLHPQWETRQQRGASCSLSKSTASPWPGRRRNSNTPRGNLTCVSVFLVMPAGPHHAGDDPSIIFIFLVVCTKPAATLIQDHRPPSARRRSRQAKTPKCNSATRPALHVQARHRPDAVTAKTPKCGPATRPARHVQARHQSDVATAVKMPKRGATTAALHIQAGAEDNGATVKAPR